MSGKGASVSHFQSRPCSGTKTLKRCNTRGEADDIVLIDVDSDLFNNVIIIDVPESLKKKHGSGGLGKEKDYPSRTVIFIDDDENTDNQQPDIDLEGGKFSSGASSSMKAGPSSSNTRRPVNGQYQFDEEIISPVKLSKCKRTYSGKTAVNRFGLDSDSGSSDNDATDWELKKKRGSSGLGKEKNYPSSSVIFIDDDENTDNQQPDIDLEGGKFNPGASSSMKAGPSSSNTLRPVNGQFQFAEEIISPVKFSKCKRTYSGKTAFNRFGLDSDSGSSDNDATDSEFMENSSGKLRHQWEKAKLKRISDGCSAQSGMPDQAGASKSSTVPHQDEAPVSSCPNKERCLKDDQSPTGPTVNRLRRPSCDPMESSFADIFSNFSEKVGVHDEDADIPLRPESLRKGHYCSKAEQQHDSVFEEGDFCFFNDGQNDQAPSSSPSNPQSNRQDSYQQDDGTPQAETSSNPDRSFCHSKASLSNNEGLGMGSCSVENNVDHVLFISRDGGKKSQHVRFNSNSPFLSESKLERCSLKQNKKSDRKESLHEDTPSDGKLFNPRTSPASENREALFGEAFSSKYPSVCKPGVSPELGKDDLVCKGSSFCNIHLDETQLKQRSCLEGKEACKKLASNCHEDERNDLLHAPDGDAVLAVESCIFNEREKQKETDEYKRALEEEWSSRQRTLKIQAEEAQQLRRLRKRQRAESMRLLDMEKRQKQRVEEIRETQKKVEENMNLKELHRAEVRKDLHKLEISCPDMASLLRGLGIQVAGGLYPLSHEVRTAYKRALLSFHPDRASGSDMRQQVEAEEKFKLISRMKEKFHDIGN